MLISNGLYIKILSFLFFLFFNVIPIFAQGTFDSDDRFKEALNINAGSKFIERGFEPWAVVDWYSFFGFPGNPPYHISLVNKGTDILKMDFFESGLSADPVITIVFGGKKKIIVFNCLKQARYYIRISSYMTPPRVLRLYSIGIGFWDVNSQDVRFQGHVFDSEKMGLQIKGASVIADNLRFCRTPFTAENDNGYYDIYLKPLETNEIITTAPGYLTHRKRYDGLEPSSTHNENRYLIPADLSLATELLQGMSGGPFPESITAEDDVDGDGQIGMAEIIFILQTVAELR